MFRRMSFAMLFLVSLGTAQSASAGNHGEWAWLKSHYKAYHDPANYPGRTVYPGSRFGFYGYVRPTPATDPVPRSMRKTSPPTMYHWSKSMRAGDHHGMYAEPHPVPEAGTYDYYAE